MSYYDYDEIIGLLCENLHDSDYNTVNDVRSYLLSNDLNDFMPVKKDNYHSVFYENSIVNISKLLQLAIDSEYAIEYSLESIKQYICSMDVYETDSILWFPPHDLQHLFDK